MSGQKLNSLIGEIAKFNSFKIEEMSDEEIKNGLVKILEHELYNRRTLIGNRQVWHRARILENHKPYNHIDGISYNKNNMEYGRCHLPGYQIFYGARNIGTALTEIGATGEQMIQIAHATTQKDVTCKAGIIGEIEYVLNSGLSIIGYDESIKNIEEFRIQNPSRCDLVVLIDAFMASHFCKKTGSKNDYKVTSNASLIYLNGGVQSLMYPSVQQRGGLNIGIPGVFFDDYFEIIGSTVLKSKCLGYGQFHIETIDTSSKILKDGNILWSGNPKPNFFNSYSLKNGYRK